MEQLVKGKTIKGKWFVRPVAWAGIWNEKWELDTTTCNTLIETPDEAMAEQYMKVYKLVSMVNEEIEKHPRPTKRLRVYKIEECEYWVSDLDEYGTLKAFSEEYGKVIGFDVTLSDIEQINDETEGMFWSFDLNEEIDRLIANMLDERTTAIREIVIGDLECKIAYCDGPAILIPFDKAIRLSGIYEKPFMIACTEC